MKQRYSALIILLFSTFASSGLVPVFVKLALESFSPILVTFFRGFFTTIILFAILFFSSRRNQQKLLHIKEYGFAPLILGASISVNMFFFSLGVSRTTLVASQLIYGLLPLSVPLLAYLLYREKPHTQKLFGGVVAIAGVLLLVLLSRSDTEQLSLGTFYGNSLIFIASLGYSVFLTASKPYTQKFSALYVSFLTYLGITLCFLPFALFTFFTTQWWGHLTSRAVIGEVALVLTSVFVIYSLQLGIQKLSATTAAIVSLMGPEFAGVLGVWLYGEQFSVSLILSMIVVLSGIFLSALGERRSLWEKFRERYSNLLAKVVRF